MAQNLEQIEQYIDKQLSDDELAAFRQRLSDSAELQQELDLHQQARQYLKDQADMQLREELLGIGDRLIKEGSVKSMRRPQRLWYGLAAAVLVLVALSVIIRMQSGPPTLDQYWASNELENIYNNYKGVNQDKNSQAEAALKLYKEGKYEAARDIWENLAASGDFPQAQLYIGMSYLKERNSQEAIQAFKVLEEQQIMLDQSYWYTALAYMDMGYQEAAIDYLCKCLVYNSKRKGATEILDKLNGSCPEG